MCQIRYSNWLSVPVLYSSSWLALQQWNKQSYASEAIRVFRVDTQDSDERFSFVAVIFGISVGAENFIVGVRTKNSGGMFDRALVLFCAFQNYSTKSPNLSDEVQKKK